jgi:hypothetical protein
MSRDRMRYLSSIVALQSHAISTNTIKVSQHTPTCPRASCDSSRPAPASCRPRRDLQPTPSSSASRCRRRDRRCDCLTHAAHLRTRFLIMTNTTIRMTTISTTATHTTTAMMIVVVLPAHHGRHQMPQLQSTSPRLTRRLFAGTGQTLWLAAL